MNARIPYFDFYPADFMHGVRGLTAQEVGVYTMILCRIYEENGPIEYNAMRLSTYCGMREATFVKTIQKLIDLDKFQVDGGMISSILLTKWMDWQRLGKARPSIPADVRRAVLSEESCAYCGSASGPFEIDHIVPWSRGGTHDIDNLTLACRPCNRSKRDKLIEEWVQ